MRPEAKIARFALEWRDRRPANGTSSRRFLDFLIDDESLYERYQLESISCLGWQFAEADEEAARRLLGEGEPDIENRVALYVCPECGDVKCGAVTAIVEPQVDEIVWRDLANTWLDWDNDETWVHDPLVPELSLLRFAADEYRRAIAERPPTNAPPTERSALAALRHRLVGRSTRATEAAEWAEALAEAQAELGCAAVELMGSRDERLTSLLRFLAEQPNTLDPFSYVSVHAPMRSESWADVVAQLAGLPARVQTIVFHPDPEIDRALLRDLGARVAIENMDVTKPSGRTVEELEPLLAALPAAGFCLDVAHVWTNDSSLALGHELLDAFGERLRQLHVSGIEPDGTHRPTTQDDLERYAPLLDRCRNVPWIFEEPLA
jgi:hypothetical protein